MMWAWIIFLVCIFIAIGFIIWLEYFAMETFEDEDD